jgi:hypothetical protein
MMRVGETRVAYEDAEMESRYEVIGTSRLNAIRILSIL